MKPPLALLLCLPLTLVADTLGDLKAFLAKQQGASQIRASVDVSSWDKGGKGKEQEESLGKAEVWVEDGPQGFHLMWNRTVLQQLEQEKEAKEKNPKAKTPLKDGLNLINPLTVSELLNGATPLLRELERGKLLEEKAETWSGKAAHLLSFEVFPKGSDEEKKELKEFKSTLKVWVGPNGFPMAAESYHAIKASKFFITVSATQEEKRTYVLVGDHLVVQRRESRNSGKAMGFDSQSVTTYAVAPQ